MTTKWRSGAASSRWLTTAVLAAVFGTAGTAHAQQPPLALDRFEPSPTGDRFFGLPSPYPGEHLMPHIGVVLDYAHDPLVLVREYSDGEQDELGSVVEHQLHLHLGASFALFDYVSLNLSMPFAIYQAGDSPAGDGTGLVSPDSAEVGDLRIGAKVRIWGDFDDPFQIGVGGYVWAPTASGDSGSFTGDGSVRGMPMLNLGGQVEWLLWSFSTGPEFRPAQELVGTTQGTMMHFGLGLAALLGPEDQVQLGPEFAVATVLDELDGRNTNAEALLGAKWRFVDFMEAGLAVGPGISSGIGTPDFRGVFSLAFTPKPEHDRDDDGIKDSADACPDKAGVESDDPQKHGCPPEGDRDGDGILDVDDACPDVAGVASEDQSKHGCPPDRDGDGILDQDDACPDKPGAPNADKSKHGCPTPTDRDGDGILDKDDACPDKTGKADPDPKKHGCPTVVVSAGEITILQKVLFDTDRATIKPISDSILNDVAEVLKKHTDIKKVEIQGHTDSQGGAEHNQGLSQRRADAVKAALVKRGIAADRLTTKGFGQSVPIGDNATPEGREKNRRVEFKILERAASSSPTR